MLSILLGSEWARPSSSGGRAALPSDLTLLNKIPEAERKARSEEWFASFLSRAVTRYPEPSRHPSICAKGLLRYPTVECREVIPLRALDRSGQLFPSLGDRDFRVAVDSGDRTFNPCGTQNMMNAYAPEVRDWVIKHHALERVDPYTFLYAKDVRFIRHCSK